MNYKAMIMDLDGTLLDTIEDIAGSMNATLEKRGFPIYKTDEYKLFVGDGMRVLTEKCLRNSGKLYTEADVQNVFMAYAARYAEHKLDNTKPYAGIEEMLMAARREGLLLAVLSNKPDTDTKAVIAYYFPDIRFEIVMGQTERIPKKPDPTAALGICDTLGVCPGQALYLGDSGVDMQLAVNADMFGVGVLWGFRSEEELLASGARTVISRPEEALAFFQS